MQKDIEVIGIALNITLPVGTYLTLLNIRNTHIVRLNPAS